jgi:hypothetical protein
MRGPQRAIPEHSVAQARVASINLLFGLGQSGIGRQPVFPALLLGGD